MIHNEKEMVEAIIAQLFVISIALNILLTILLVKASRALRKRNLESNVDKTKIMEKLKAKFPEYSASISNSPADSESLWVQVFNVPEKDKRPVSRFITTKLQKITKKILLPMVKSTKEVLQNKE
jgi:hypothetical protein